MKSRPSRQALQESRLARGTQRADRHPLGRKTMSTSTADTRQSLVSLAPDVALGRWGAVDSLDRPGGSTTGFMLFEYSLSGKWVDLLKQIAPNVTRAAVIRDATNPSGIGQFSAIQGAAQSLAIEVSAVGIRDADEIQRAVAALARSRSSGLIVTGSAGASVFRDLIIELAARHKLPAVYSDSYNVAVGGLISYGPNRISQFRRAASYIDRILKGEKPADLPVQAPTKYELAINLKTAKALGLTVPPSLLASADQVIE